MFFVWLIWVCLMQTPDHQKGVFLKHVFPSKSALKKLLRFSGIIFAPGLLNAVQSASPPTISYFKTLPLHLSKVWAVYLLVLEKRGSRPRIYIGTGTEKRSGVRTRLGQYRRGENYSKYVQKAVDEGYKVTHTGLLCWAPLPTASKRFPLHALLLMIEAVLSLYFWTMHSRTKDYGVGFLTPWDLAAFEYDGCCGHVPMREQIKDTKLNMSDAQIDAADKERKLRNSRRDYLKRGPVKAAASAKKRRDKALANKENYCDICHLNFGAANQLANHKLLPIHIDKANGVIRLVKNPRTKQRHAENIANRKYYCSHCEYPAPTQQKLTAHNKTATHRAVLEAKGIKLLA